MKKISTKARKIDVVRELKKRKNYRKERARRNKSGSSNNAHAIINDWVDDQINQGLDATVSRNRVVLRLPEKMNFASLYEKTTQIVMAIRRLIEPVSNTSKSYRLGMVDFSNLKEISTSAALVLTAELSRWDDTIRNNLRPFTKNWDPDIYQRFYDLGFFDLFSFKQPEPEALKITKNTIKQVKYIKGKTGDRGKTTELKDEIKRIVQDDVSKWTFLHSGLTEAITNVTHHAYPKELKTPAMHKNWYLSGAFDESSRELKIVFYDQGIGIPKSLPTSNIWEKALDFLSFFPAAERKRDEVLLQAAVSLERTSTGDSDRGRGLQDLLEFIKQRKNGYISIISRKGLYKYTMINGEPTVKTFPFKRALYGTLIIWNVELD